jgi:bifunctional DNA-binding transcriptional regulator/antitoxin component of YhaV-PrlF toxin-antitoxin module
MISAQVRVREDGSIPMPKELLNEVKLKPNDEVVAFEEKGHLVIATREQLAEEFVRLLQGSMGDTDINEALRELEEGRRDDPQRG